MIFRLVLLGALVASTACAPARITTTTRMPVLDAPAHRVVALVPSMAEDLFAVGAGAAVVGVSVYTDYPPAAKKLPQVATFASVSTERIVALHPDLVVGIIAQQRLVSDLRRAKVRTLLLHDDGYDDIFKNLRTLGAETGHVAGAAASVLQLRARTSAILASVAPRARKPSVFIVLGTAPIFTVGRGSYIDTLIGMAGGSNAASGVTQPYARYSAEALLARQPDVLIADPDVHLGDVLGQAPWSALRAVREHRVYVLPDGAILERPGPRYNEGLAWLVATLARVPT